MSNTQSPEDNIVLREHGKIVSIQFASSHQHLVFWNKQQLSAGESKLVQLVLIHPSIGEWNQFFNSKFIEAPNMSLNELTSAPVADIHLICNPNFKTAVQLTKPIQSKLQINAEQIDKFFNCKWLQHKQQRKWHKSLWPILISLKTTVMVLCNLTTIIFKNRKLCQRLFPAAAFKEELKRGKLAPTMAEQPNFSQQNRNPQYPTAVHFSDSTQSQVSNNGNLFFPPIRHWATKTIFLLVNNKD